MTGRDVDRDNRALVAALAEASWRQADEALAHAWRDMHRLEALLSRKKDRTVADEAAFIVDALALAARARGLERRGDVGDVVVYDRALHESDGDVLKRACEVRIIAPGVARRVDGGWQCVARARVALARAPKAPSRATPASSAAQPIASEGAVVTRAGTRAKGARAGAPTSAVSRRKDKKEPVS